MNTAQQADIAVPNEAQIRALYEQLMALLPGCVHSHPPLPPYYTGYVAGTLHDWDQYFEGILQLYAGFPFDYARNALRIYFAQQEGSGFIPRTMQPAGSFAPIFKHRDHVKPFLAQLIWLGYLSEQTVDWLRADERYDRLKRYLDYWLKDMDVRGGGLSVWRHAGHSGMDNHHERAGEIDRARQNEPMFCEGVDLNAYLVREAQAMAQLADVLGAPDDRQHYADAAKAREEAMRRDLWDEDEGIFYDHHAHERRPIRVKHVGVFASLWAGVATEAQADRLVSEHLLNENEFWRPWPIPALAASEPTYVEGYLPHESTGCCSWRAHTWLPTNYYTFQGLRRYGYHDVAQELAARTFKLFDRGKFSEYYTSESGVGTGRKPFGGWTGLALFMQPELALDVDPTRLSTTNDAFAKMRRWLIQGAP